LRQEIGLFDALMSPRLVEQDEAFMARQCCYFDRAYKRDRERGITPSSIKGIVNMESENRLTPA
jgi:hypothetical protein